jgi:hypothetical protein
MTAATDNLSGRRKILHPARLRRRARKSSPRPAARNHQDLRHHEGHGGHRITPDCTDPDLVGWIAREPTSKSSDISGSGIVSSEALVRPGRPSPSATTRRAVRIALGALGHLAGQVSLHQPALHWIAARWQSPPSTSRWRAMAKSPGRPPDDHRRQHHPSLGRRRVQAFGSRSASCASCRKSSSAGPVEIFDRLLNRGLAHR